MGEIIAKTAAAGDIMADLKTAMTNAAARGGTTKSDAERFLQQVVGLAEEIAIERELLEEAVEPLKAAVEAADSEADDLVAGLYDETYNAVGRPGYDPLLSLLYPNGSSAYTEGPTSEQPERMKLLANLLERKVHPGIPAARLPDMVRAIRESAARLHAAVTAAQSPQIQNRQLEKIYVVLAKSGQIQLSRLKRFWKSLGMSEADIHEIIPDRPRTRKGKGPKGDGDGEADGSAGGSSAGG